MTLLDILKGLRTERPYSYAGICDTVFILAGNKGLKASEALFDLKIAMAKVNKGWPKWTGSKVFPIPSPLEGIDYSQAYTLAAGSTDAKDERIKMWTGQYGALRLEYLEFLIAHLESR